MNNSLKNKTLLVVNVATFKKKYILERLFELGIKIICINSEKIDWAAPYIQEWIIADTFNHEESINQIELFKNSSTNFVIDGVITFWEDDVLLTSKITDKFGFVGISYQISKNTRNKFAFREFCQNHAIPSPKHILIKDKNDLNGVYNTFDFPLIIKPVFGSHSAFVTKIENKNDCEKAVLYIRQHLSANIESALSDGSDILVEEYLDGQEIDIDLLIQDGVIKYFSITDNEKTKEPYFVETGESTPSSLSARDQDNIIKMAKDAIQKLNIQNGCLHFEAKLTSKGPIPIEVNLRMGGGEVYFYNKNVWGVDLVEQAAKIALSIPCNPEKTNSPLVYMATEQFLPDHSGIINSIDIDKSLKDCDYVKELVFEKKPSEKILAAPEGFDCLGWVTVAGSSAADAKAKLEDVKKTIHIDIE
jgi:biotin carboxylase